MKQNTTYKQTELGLIPEDWEVKKLGEILKEYSLGGNYENNSEESGIPLIKMGNIGRGKIDLSKIEYLPKNVNYSKNDILKYNDILFNTRNTLDLVGKVSIWKNEALFALYNSNLLRLYFKEDFDVSEGSAEEIFIKASKITFEKLIPKFLKEKIIPYKQDGVVTIFKRRNPSQSNLNTLENISLDRIYDFIRMLDAKDYPKAYLLLNNKYKIEFFSVKKDNNKLIGKFEVIENE